ncbi:MAG: TonB family protein [Acidobacteriota bacterium]
MFEQTLLTNPVTPRKTAALITSFVAQIVVTGVLVVAPLLYTQALPMPSLAVVFAAPIIPQPPQPPPVVEPQKARTSARALGVFRAPTRVPTAPIPENLVENTIESPELQVNPAGQIPAFFTGAPELPPLARAPVAPEPAKPIPSVTKPAEISVVISSGVLAGKLITQVIPRYPDLARRMRISGIVQLLGIVGKDGRVRSLRVIDGHPMLRQAAYDAVSQWIYSPTVLNGLAVEVEAPIEVRFALQ